MKQIVLNIKESKYKFFIELVKSLGFVEIVSKPSVKTKSSEENDKPNREEILDGLEESFKELKLYKEGKIKFKNAKDLIDEL